MPHSFGPDTSWSLNDDVLTVSATGPLRTPAWDASAWESRDQVRTIVLEEGITVIPALCFQDYAFLETVQLPSTLTYLGAKAFRNCPQLQAIEPLCDIRSIEKDAFEGTRLNELQDKLREAPAAIRPYEQLSGDHAEAIITDAMRNLLTGVPYDQQLESYTAWVSEKENHAKATARKFNENAAKALVVKEGIVVGIAFETHIGESLLMNSGNWEPVKFRPTAFRFLHDDIIACRWSKMEFAG
ncbi:MAG: leucine-rich repeat protein [Eggerthellales bacterium]|nr:leucine-rich repeat protein [Eggerthellales bacterium]